MYPQRTYVPFHFSIKEIIQYLCRDRYLLDTLKCCHQWRQRKQFHLKIRGTQRWDEYKTESRLLSQLHHQFPA